jgi:predicted CoA-substrate-specific enzyme activase
MIHAGIDAGSRAIKIVLLDIETGSIVATGIRDQGVAQEALAREVLENLLVENGIDRGDVARMVATGYGRNIVRFCDTTITEITCHARGVRHLLPEARTIIEIGGQDSKVVRLKENGTVQDFNMNDRCAAGTGRFLEVVATRLGVELPALGEMAGRSKRAAAISSMCVVFAETEIIGLLAGGIEPEDIAAGVQAAISSRVASMAGRSIEAPVVFTGGVALIPGMASALESVVGHPLEVPPDPQMTGALGAALLAGAQS